MCILPVLVASEAIAASEAMADTEVRYDLIFEISNLSYPVINVHIACFWWPRRPMRSLVASEVAVILKNIGGLSISGFGGLLRPDNQFNAVICKMTGQRFTNRI